jgi:pyrroline-5-carboxylate reductase
VLGGIRSAQDGPNRTESTPLGTSIRVFDPNMKQATLFESRFGATPTSSAKEAVSGAGIVVISCKPQNLSAVFHGITGHVSDDALVVSIVAGCPISRIRQGIGCDAAIVRSMPNTPVSLFRGWGVGVAHGASRRHRTFGAQLSLPK